MNGAEGTVSKKGQDGKPRDDFLNFLFLQTYCKVSLSVEFGSFKVSMRNLSKTHRFKW